MFSIVLAPWLIDSRILEIKAQLQKQWPRISMGDPLPVQAQPCAVVLKRRMKDVVEQHES